MRLNSEIWAAIVGLFMPYAVEAIKVVLPSKRWVAYSLALLVSVIVGGASSYFGGEFNAESILSSTGTALIASQGVYNFYFKDNNQDKKVSSFVRKVLDIFAKKINKN